MILYLSHLPPKRPDACNFIMKHTGDRWNVSFLCSIFNSLNVLGIDNDY